MPDDAELKKMYVDDYFSPDGCCRPTTPGGYLDKEDLIRSEAVGLLKYLGDRRGRFLEIGCAGGFFLDEARAAGFDVMGIEGNSSMARHAREKLGLPVDNRSVFDVHFEPGSFDVVASNRVLEHLPPIHETLKKIASWLRPGGLLLISGPLEDTARGDLWWHANRLRGHSPTPIQEPPYHVHGFTRASWGHLMRRSGFRMLNLRVNPDSMHLGVHSAKDLLAWPLEIAGWVGDRVSGRGSFMISLAEVMPQERDAAKVPPA